MTKQDWKSVAAEFGAKDRGTHLDISFADTRRMVEEIARLREELKWRRGVHGITGEVDTLRVQLAERDATIGKLREALEWYSLHCPSNKTAREALAATAKEGDEAHAALAQFHENKGWTANYIVERICKERDQAKRERDAQAANHSNVTAELSQSRAECAVLRNGLLEVEARMGYPAEGNPVTHALRSNAGADLLAAVRGIIAAVENHFAWELSVDADNIVLTPLKDALAPLKGA